MKILHLDSSILASGSVKAELSRLVVERLSEGADATIVYRNLAVENLPHVTVAALPEAHNLSAMAGELDENQRAVRADSDKILEEFLTADVLVIGAPMYNFTIPSQLKAWLDRIIVPGKTYRYGAHGPEGLAGGKRVIVTMARGGFYGAGSIFASAEHAESYLTITFGFLGITDLEFIIAEGLAVEGNKTTALDAAREAVAQLEV